MQTRRLVALVVTHNRLEKLKVTLGRLLDDDAGVLAGCVVFDNASSDGTPEWLSSLNIEGLTVELSRENLGGAGGFAAGMKLCRTHYDPDWIVVMDDDARPLPATLNRFVSEDRTQAVAWAARVTYPDETLCDMNRPWVNPFSSWRGIWRGLTQGRDGFHIADTENAVRQIDGASFVGLFVSRRAIDLVGYPDADLFLYGDDVLFTLAVSRTAGAVMYDPALTFEHDCETLTPDSTLHPLWKVYFFHRNQVFVIRAAAGAILFWPVLLLRVCQWVVRARRYGPVKSAYLRLLRMAIVDGVRKRKFHTRKSIEKILNGY